MKYRSPLRNLSFRPLIAISGLFAIILCALLCFSTIFIAGLGDKQVVSADTLQAGATLEVRDVASAAPVTTQTCVPMGQTVVPTAIALPAASNGLVQNIEQPTLYQIFGSSANALRSQVQACAPRAAGLSQAEFTAETNYQLNWRYDYIEIGGGQCRVSNASVGIHINQVMPQWIPSKDASPKLVNQWNDFMKSLDTHEKGHVTLDLQYAQMLLNDIKNFPAVPCGQIQESIRHLADTDANQLIQANDNYDEATNHGATQGAILP